MTIHTINKLIAHKESRRSSRDIFSLGGGVQWVHGRCVNPVIRGNLTSSILN